MPGPEPAPPPPAPCRGPVPGAIPLPGRHGRSSPAPPAIAWCVGLTVLGYFWSTSKFNSDPS
ncbi:hypothetical protein EAO71_34265 [Streptomyces sp. ms191]|nr:hypothetical protein EAO71_34265 [Streptomyces sp. ms191]